MRASITLTLILLFAGTSAAAEGQPWIKQTVYGMDCAPCAYAMERSLGRISGVTSVEVNLNQGLATLHLANDAEPDIGEIREITRRNGFTPRAAEIRLIGQVIKENGDYVLQVGGRRFALAAGEELSDSGLHSLVGRRVTATGHVPEQDAGRLVADTLERQD